MTRRTTESVVLGAVGGAALALAAVFCLGLLSPRAPAAGPLGGLIPLARADVGKGEYLFLPCRKEMWVVNKVNGKLVHYQFFDNEMGTVERSRVAVVDANIFPMRDTDFILSDRNLTSYLWVVNRATGDFEMWRASRDGTLHTDELPVPAGDHLRVEAVEPERGTSGRNAGLRGSGRPPSSPEAPSSQRPSGKKRLEPQTKRPSGTTVGEE